MLEIPKSRGDKNITLVKDEVRACISELNPGAINLVKAGAKIIPKPQKSLNQSIKYLINY